MKKTIGVLATAGLVVAGIWKTRRGRNPKPESRPGGMTVLRSEHDFESTIERLIESLEGAEEITFVFPFDHAEEAADADVDIPPTTVVLFSSPALGAALTGSSQTAGLDLPHRFLVWEDQETVWLAWNDPRYLAQRHGIEVRRNVFDSISELLEEIATGVAGS